VVGNRFAVDILPAPMRGAMSNDETVLDTEDEFGSDDLDVEGPLEDELFDEEEEDDEDLLEPPEDEEGEEDDDEEDTEALDDLEAEELEMLTDDEAQETIVVDEEAQLRDIRRAQIAMEVGEAGGAQANEFVCSVCFLVKKSSQLANRRKKICLDCAE
jgi:hypothetical protein